jgi:hypothetical protein
MQNTTHTQSAQSVNPTLFARYKSFINECLAHGKTEYTAKELNLNVGMYEASTWWKRANNNQYYTTRLYQGLLREFGCLTMVKRGLWKINAPIPEWFGSFHFNGLRGRIDKNCFYWHNLLPAEHKVNPWANLSVKAANDAALIPVEEIKLSHDVPGLTCDFEVSVDKIAYSCFKAEVTDYTLYLHDTQISYSTAQELCKAYGVDFSRALDGAMDIAKDQALNVAKREALNAELDAVKAANAAAAEPAEPAEKTYTKSEVMQILQKFVKTAYEQIDGDVDDILSGADATDYVEISVDYGFQLSVDLDMRSLTKDVQSAVDEGLQEALDNFDLEDAIAKQSA